MKPLRLCFVGPANSVTFRRWVEWFAERGHETTVLTVEPAEAGAITGFRQIDLCTWPGLRKLGRIVSAVRLAAMIRRLRPDIVHVQYARGVAWGLTLVRRHPCVVTPWGSDVLEEQGAFKEPYSRALTSWVLRLADLITVHSGYMEDRVRPLLQPEARLVRVGWGVNLLLFRPGLGVQSLRWRWNIGEHRRVIFSPRLAQRLYNHDRIIRALPAICEKIPQALLVVTEQHADPEYVAELRRLASDLRIADHVRFVGAIPYSDMPRWLNLAQAAVMLPRSDGMPNTLLEAMACGAVPVLSRLPQYAEVIKQGVNGFLVDLDQGDLAGLLIDLLSNDALREDIARRNRQIVMGIGDQDKEMARMEELYGELVATDGGTGQR